MPPDLGVALEWRGELIASLCSVIPATVKGGVAFAGAFLM